MKKVLSLLLVFMFSLTVLGITQDVSAEAVDVSIYVHVYEFDGDYTNSGTGLWDGVNWNNWDDSAATTDSFGGIIQIDYTAAELALVDDSLQFKPTSDITLEDSAPLLGAGNGEVYLDVIDLKAGSAAGTMTELHAYFVEGSDAFYVADVADNGIAFFLYVNPGVASNPGAYDGWGVHTWNAGSEGTSIPDYFADIRLFEINVELDAGEYAGVPMRLGAIEVDSDASNEIGFIVHYGATGEEEVKSCSADMSIDVTAIKDGGAQLDLYEHGLCDFTADYATFIDNVEDNYRLSLKNKFVEGTQISNPETINVTFFGPKQPFDLTMDRFTVKDSAGAIVPILSMDIAGTVIANYASEVVIQSETAVVVYVDTALDHSLVGLVGSVQGWDPANPIVSLGDDTNGYAIYEFTSFDAEAQFKFLFDTSGDGMEWSNADDVELIAANIVVDLSAGGTVLVYFDDATDTVGINPVDGYTVDPTMYTYTPAATCAEGENLLTVFLESDLDETKLGLVGSVQGWSPETALMADGVTTEGQVYWEVCTADVDGGFKILFDTSGDGMEWSNADDVEVTANNQNFDFGDATEIGLMVDPVFAATLDLYTPTLMPSSVYQVTAYILGDLDVTKLGIVGFLQDNPWTPAEAIAPTMDAFGNYVFDFATDTKTPEFKVLYDADDDGFDWDDSLSGGSNIQPDLGSDTVGYVLVDATDLEAVVVTDLGASIEISGNTVTQFALNFADDALMFGETYTIEYLEAADPEEIIMWDLEFNTSNEFAPANPAEEMGTYAVLPNEIKVTFENYTPALTNLMLKDSMGVEVPVETYGLAEMIGTYTSTNTCDANMEMIYVHVAIETEVATLAQLGLVGTINGWNIDGTIPAVGMDSEGNYVFEVCVWTVAYATGDGAALLVTQTTTFDDAVIAYDAAVAAEALVVADVLSTQQQLDDAAAATAAAETAKNDAETAKNNTQAGIDGSVGGEFKVKFDPDADGFTWSSETDPEFTPGNVAFTVADGPNFFVVEGASALDSSMNHMIMLAAANVLDNTDTYMLEFEDENGFMVYIDVAMDAEAPEVDFAVIPDVVFEINDSATALDLLDYYTRIAFLDNRDGELVYEVLVDLDFTMTGDQTITIGATDSWDNTGYHNIVFNVIDTTDPVLTIDAAMTFTAGDEEPDWTMYASTNEGTITVDAAQVDMAVAGSFFVNYTAEDEAGNTATGSLEVTIEAGEAVVADSGCFGAISIGSSIAVLIAALGGALVFFTKRH